MEDSRQMADLKVRDLPLIALTVSSGAIDAISYLGLGKVFTAFMTGNIVFLGLRTASVGAFTVTISSSSSALLSSATTHTLLGTTCRREPSYFKSFRILQTRARPPWATAFWVTPSWLLNH